MIFVKYLSPTSQPFDAISQLLQSFLGNILPRLGCLCLTTSRGDLFQGSMLLTLRRGDRSLRLPGIFLNRSDTARLLKVAKVSIFSVPKTFSCTYIARRGGFWTGRLLRCDKAHYRYMVQLKGIYRKRSWIKPRRNTVANILASAPVYADLYLF